MYSGVLGLNRNSLNASFQLLYKIVRLLDNAVDERSLHGIDAQHVLY